MARPNLGGMTGILRGRGLTDQRVYCDDLETGVRSPPEQKESLFLILPKLNYSASEQLHKELAVQVASGWQYYTSSSGG